jgi:DNA-binding CsgD family transcriptional regulator
MNVDDSAVIPLWMAARAEPALVIDALRRIPAEEQSGDVEAVRTFASFRAGEVTASAALLTLDVVMETRPSRGAAEDLVLHLARSQLCRSLGRTEEAVTEISAARAHLASVRHPHHRLALTADVFVEEGLIRLVRGELAEAHDALLSATSLGVLPHATAQTAWAGIAVTTYIFGDPIDADASLRRVDAGPSAGGTDAAALRDVAALLLAPEHGPRAEFHGIADAVEPANATAPWGPLTIATHGYFRARESQFPEALEQIQRVASDLHGYWAEWVDMIRAFVHMRLGGVESGWKHLARVRADDRHALCPYREISALRLRLNDLPGAEAAISECESIGDRHVPRSRMATQWLRAAVELRRGRSAESDLHADVALLTMARNDTTGPMYFPPIDDIRALVARARARGTALPLLDRIAALDDHSRLVQNFVALTPRERDVLSLLSAGASGDRIADELVLSRNTIKTHLRRVYSKLGATSAQEAVRIARWMGLDV